MNGSIRPVPIGEGQRWRHNKRGTEYEIIGVAELQAGQPQCERAELAIYRGEDGKLWARNTGEFTDGRFTLATHPAQPSSAAGEPEGWVLVPREPTEAMTRELYRQGCTNAGWAEVLAAAPSAPPSTDAAGEVERLLLEELAAYLPSMRVFLTSGQRPHEAGVKWHDEIIAKVNAAREARHV